MEVTKSLASFVEEFSWENISEEMVKKSKMHVLDTVGIALRGSTTEHVAQARQVVEILSGDSVSTVFGSSFKTNAYNAAFLNSTMAHSIDFDDSHKFVHPGAVVIPTALSVAEWKQLSGRDLITSILLGYELSIRLSLAAGLTHRRKGYHPTSTCNYIGATTATSKLLGLTTDQIANAYGVATTQASGLTQYRFDGSPNKHLHAGLAAKGGILASLMANAGFKGTKNSIDGKFGFLNVLAEGGDAPDALTNELGEKMLISDVDIKPYPSCRQTHAPIDLMLDVANGEKFDLEEIEKIDLYLYEYATESWLVDTSPRDTSLQAMLNVPYCMAVALIDKEVTLDQFSNKKLRDSKVINLAEKIKIGSKKEFTVRFPEEKNAEVIITLSNGDTIHRLTRNPVGSRDKPLTYLDVQDKFQRLLKPITNQSNIDSIIEWVDNLDKHNNMVDVASLLK